MNQNFEALKTVDLTDDDMFIVQDKETGFKQKITKAALAAAIGGGGGGGGPVLIETQTGADLVLDGTDPDANYNFFEFDLTGVEAPPNGYRLEGSFYHAGFMGVPDRTIYLDINEGAVSDPYNNGTYANDGSTLIQAFSPNGLSAAYTSTLFFTTGELVSMNGLEFTQDLLIRDFGGTDGVFGHGHWTQFSASQMNHARTTKKEVLATSFLDGTFKHIRLFNFITNVAAAGSYDLKTNPLDNLTISLYAI